MARERSFLALALAVACALGGCSGDGNLVRDVAVASGITGGEPKPAPDFVARTRPAELEYMPIGKAPPPRTYRAKDKKAVTEAESEMAGLRARNEQRGAAARRAGGAAAKPAAEPADD